MKKRKITAQIAWLCITLFLCSGCASESKETTKDIFAMDTYMTITAYGSCGEKAVAAAEKEIQRLDLMLSTGDGNSEVSKLNLQGEAEVSGDTMYLLERSLEIYRETDGAFDISIYPVMKLWGFPSGNFSVPDEDELRENLKLADASKIILDSENSYISFEQADMEIDLGGIAKGYTSSRIMDIFRESGVKSGMVSLGGNVQVLGTKPDGSLWRVAIEDPSKEGYLGVLETKDHAVITSGGYERYFEQDGKTYHHIIDPATGYPAESGLTSVMIVSEDGTLADALSTSLFIMGKERAQQFWQEHSEMFDMILLEESGTLYVTEPIAEQFSGNREAQVIEGESL